MWRVPCQQCWLMNQLEHDQKKKKKTKQINHHYTLVLSLIKTLSEIMTYQKYYSHDNTVLLTQKYLLVLVLAKGLGFL